MYRFPFILGVILGLCMVSQWSWAEKAYVADSFNITFRSGPSVENKIIDILLSGQPLEVLDSLGDWSHVQLLENGQVTKEGWVLSRYLMTRQPWKIQADSLVEENTRLKEQLTPAENKLSEALGREQMLTMKLQDRTEALRKTSEEYESLKQESKEYLRLRATYRATRSQLEIIQKDFQVVTEEIKNLRSSQRNKWFVTGALVLLCGLLMGLILGRRRKKRPSSLYY